MMQQLAWIDNLAEYIFNANTDKGFWEQPQKAIDYFKDDETKDLSVLVIPRQQYLLLKKMEKLGLIVTEVAEGMEAIRKPGPSEHIPEFTSEEEEVADAFIRLCDYAGGFNLRLADAVQAKLLFNSGRPKKHGKAF